MKQAFVGLVVIVLVTFYGLWVRDQQHTSAAAQSTPASSQTASNVPNQTSAGSESVAPPTSTPGLATPSEQFKDGTFTGSVADAYYGNVQVSATVSGGRLSSVRFLQYPSDHETSVMINHDAMPLLQQEAIKAQSAQVQIVSGATFTSQAFVQSLASALSQAQA